MGQCYSVSARLKYRKDDPAMFCRLVQEKIRSIIAKDQARFDLDGLDLSNPYDCFRAITRKDAVEENGEYLTADFSASYGWGTVMLNVFEYAFKGLKYGSRIYVYPDEGRYEIGYTKDMKIKVSSY